MTGSDFGSLLPNSLTAWLVGALTLAFLFVPLGIWKAVEIVIWVCHHIHWK